MAIALQALTYNKMAPMALGRIDIKYRRIACQVPQNLDVIVDENRGAGGWIRLQVKVSSSLLIALKNIPIVPFHGQLSALKVALRKAVKLGIWVGSGSLPNRVSVHTLSSRHTSNCLLCIHKGLMWHAGCRQQRVNQDGPDKGPQHKLADSEQCLGRLLGDWPGPPDSPRLPHPG